ncbi:MAG: IS110 family transposase [Deltaproteobacteria bacterium]|nr:IS110 family transposase [Deltaproteobacteria bacterium]
MKVDIDELTEAELIDLNHRIVERLRFLSQMRAHGRMLEFKIGDRVTFQPRGRPPVFGMLTRYNRKTVTVITDDGHHWKVRANEIKALREDRITSLLKGDEELWMAGRASREVIDFLTHQIHKIEGWVQKKMVLKEAYRYLLSLPGVGKILALTIMLETGPIGRFATVGDYVSYCRKVPSQWTSDRRRKGAGNTKNGNKYLAWAYYGEASELAQRYDSRSRAYYQHKANFSPENGHLRQENSFSLDEFT